MTSPVANTPDAEAPPTGQSLDVVGIGVSTLDLLMLVDELPGDEMVQRAETSLLQGGGPVATALVTLVRLGCRAALLDKLGDDWRGRLILEELAREGVATDQLRVVPGSTSSIASILARRRDGARTIVYSPGDAGELSPNEIDFPVIAAAKILHLNGRHLEASLAAARFAREQGVLVSFDGGAHRYREELRELVGLSDLCVVAREFACSFAGTGDQTEAAARLREQGAQTVVITAGKEGSWGWDAAGTSLHQPAFTSVHAIDSTGAGDAFHGGFLFGILRGFDFKRSLECASTVAALNTRALGGRTALPRYPELRDFLLNS
ncbi:ribokinase [Geomonas limicola]|uniref:Ribokinase n=1 Tax=Geomonas limicola TaxID=2740186 RepID=A0A6V8N6F0_9BACT|nr:PfkB family carbohydrate kinase [Geomonas limicola]GFO68138.1 ribokinase [Geomonas limicola]